MEIIEFMKQTARQAGLIALADREMLNSGDIHTKATALDLVTETDRKVERYITSCIAREYPDYGIYGEEGGKTHADREHCFVIDPIDGTASFVHHLPNWCVSIGLHRNGKPVAGVVYQPVTGDIYYAEAGKGAYLNGSRISIVHHEKLQDCILTFGFACLRAQWKEENNLKYLCRIAPLTADVRKYGSAALDCCLVASGATDGYWELYLEPYDIGAGEIIAREAGAKITDLRGQEEYPDSGFLCASPEIHAQLLPFFHDYKHLKR